MAHLIPLDHAAPLAHPTAFLAPTAVLSGDVQMGERSSAFYGVSARGDSGTVRIGARTNLQDNVVVHADADAPCRIGDDVSVGHTAVIHGCTIGNGCLIGMSATIMNHAEVGEYSLIAAGALVLEGTKIPPRSLVAGAPAKVRRELSEDEVEALKRNAETYVGLAERHRAATGG
ncbi:gamma carbonic anhydrase family protein [Galactobacter caseinivorans]|uniref:Gamma carbonic anhydrase family protein n=1 Tax=Galactobacter caseinivorans TaxID=2676123 RepID=A0A496PFY9_9MICC|nr:gamma carbonic anhydrase family protein [Galactobacter caseinivorans]RKW69493.1 gamma carbonic anhydrase family protein [Galactobacter caseinivorans]